MNREEGRDLPPFIKLASVLDRRKKQADQDRGGRDDDKQFDERKAHSVLESIYSVLHDNSSSSN